MIPVEQALELVLARTQALGSERIAFQQTLGRVLAEDVTSDLNMPPFDRSGVDGFAIRSQDIAETPSSLRIIGEIAAGQFPEFVVEPKTAARIMTGAPVPRGADCVQMVEQTRSEEELVWIHKTIAAGENIAPLGSEVRLGDTVLRAGARMDPPAIAVAASVGATDLAVGKRPSIAVVATGDELVEPSTKPGPGQIRNSNGYSVVAQCRSLGCKADFLGVAKDNTASLEDLLGRGLTYDILLISGGVSMGEYDLVEGVLEAAGVRFAFDAVALKPGKPLVFGTTEPNGSANGKLVFGLPGNPVSTMVTFELFVRPAISRLEGVAAPVRPLLRAKLTHALKNRGARRAFLPGWLERGSEGGLEARPIRTRGSGDIVAFAKANALLIVPEQDDLLAPKEPVDCYPLDSFLTKSNRWGAPSGTDEAAPK